MTVRRSILALLALALGVAGCSRPAAFVDLGIRVSARGDRCFLALRGAPVGDLDDFQTKLKLRAALPHHPFSTGIRTVGTVPSACIQKVYEVLRTAHVQTAGIIAASNEASVEP